MRRLPLICLLCVHAHFLGYAQTIGAVVNAATFDDKIASGSIATIFGPQLASGIASATTQPLPTKLLGTSVVACRVENPKCNQAAPLFYVGPTQINFLATDAILRVVTGNSSSAPFQVTLQPSAPRIFRIGYDCAYPASCPLSASPTLKQTVQRGAVIDQTGRTISSTNPIRAHEFYSLFLTGLVSSADFSISNTVYATGQNINQGVLMNDYGTVEYLGPAPGFTGLLQLNFQLPSDIRRAFTDGVNLPYCHDVAAAGDLRTEGKILIDSYCDIFNPSTRLSISGEVYDAVDIPILIHPDELDCRR